MPSVYQASEITEEQARLFLEPNYAVVATLRKDGSAHQTIVWIDWDGESVVFNTAEGRAKPRNIRRDPRVSVLVSGLDDPYRWISVSGRAEMTTEGALEHINKLSWKYNRRDFPLPPGEVRLLVRVRPEHVTAYGV